MIRKNAMEEKSKETGWRLPRISGLYIREIIGWVLVLAGLRVFQVSLSYLGRGLVIEGMIVVTIGIMIFRGGLQLVKVSVAARAFRVDRQAIATRGQAE